MDLMLEKVKKEAEVYKIPKAMDETISFIQDIILENGVESILEIGTGNGFSAISFSQCKCVKKIYTFERDPQRIPLCRFNLKYFPKISFFPVNFFEFDENVKFDLIFIDGMKRNYQKFFEISCKYAHDNTLFISDNLNFKDHLKDADKLEKKHRRITDKISDYIDFLKRLEDYETDFFFEKGDGVSVTKKKK